MGQYRHCLCEWRFQSWGCDFVTHSREGLALKKSKSSLILKFNENPFHDKCVKKRVVTSKVVGRSSHESFNQKLSQSNSYFFICVRPCLVLKKY